MSISLGRDNDEAIVTVTDSGPGIFPGEVDHVFARYYRAPGGARVSGAGLGLAIAKQIVTRQSGRIDVASREGAGSNLHDSAAACDDSAMKGRSNGQLSCVTASTLQP